MRRIPWGDWSLIVYPSLHLQWWDINLTIRDNYLRDQSPHSVRDLLIWNRLITYWPHNETMWIVSDQSHNLTSMHRSYQHERSMCLLMLDIRWEVDFYATIKRLETFAIDEDSIRRSETSAIYKNILRYLGMRDWYNHRFRILLCWH